MKPTRHCQGRAFIWPLLCGGGSVWPQSPRGLMVCLISGTPWSWVPADPSLSFPPLEQQGSHHHLQEEPLQPPALWAHSSQVSRTCSLGQQLLRMLCPSLSGGAENRQPDPRQDRPLSPRNRSPSETERGLPCPHSETCCVSRATCAMFWKAAHPFPWSHSPEGQRPLT